MVIPQNRAVHSSERGSFTFYKPRKMFRRPAEHAHTIQPLPIPPTHRASISAKRGKGTVAT